MLQLYPAVVVGLDDRSYQMAAAWHSRLDPDARTLARCARDIEGVREALSIFSTLNFQAILRSIGVEPPAGARVRVVSVAYAMGKVAFSGWAEWDRQVMALRREVITLEHVRVLLARPDEHPREERNVVLGEAEVPWLLSTRLSDALRISNDHLQDLFALLMRVLLFAERQPVQHQTVFDGQHIPGYVRLLGFMPESAGLLSPRIEQFVAGVVLTSICDGHRGPSDPVRERSMLAFAREFSRGEADAAGVLKRLLGRAGLASWDLAELLLGAEALVRRALHLIESRPAPQATLSQAPRMGCLQSLVMLLARLVGLRIGQEGKTANTEVPEGSPGQEDLAFIKARLATAVLLFAEFKTRMPRQTGMQRIPSELIAAWRKSLEAYVHESLVRIAGEAEGEPLSAEECLGRWMAVIRSDLLGHLKEMLDDWQLPLPEEIESLRRQMNLTQSVKYTGGLLGGMKVGFHSCVCSRTIPADCQNIQVLKFRGGGDFVFLASSEPVPVSHLAW